MIINDFFQNINKKYGTMGGSSVIVNNNKIEEELIYGLASREKNISVDIDTVYRIASISKLIVATATMTLVEKGLIDLDEDISKYLGFQVRNPKYPDKVINLKMIMTQTSSITDGYEEGVNSNKDTGYNEYIMLDEIIPLYDFLNPNGSKWVDETFSDYEPGIHYEYANLGCGIQACIIEHITGIKFTKYVRDKILLPLGLDASFDIRDIKNPNIATCYTNKGGELKISRTKEDFAANYYIKDRGLGNNYVGPAGGLFISAKDLAKLMLVFMNDGTSPEGIKILEKESMDRMLELTWVGVGDGDYTAKGLQFKCMDFFTNATFGPVRLYGHFGGAYGVKSFLLFNPTQKIGFVYIINGGLFHNQSGKPCDLHEEYLNELLKLYWNKNQKHHLELIYGDKLAILDGRTINLKYITPPRIVASKVPFLDAMSMIDCFSIPTIINGVKVIEELKEKLPSKHIVEYMSTPGLFFDYKKIIELLPDGRSKLILDYEPKKEFPGNETLDYEMYENYHTHCAFCNHADGMPIDYAKEAYENGYELLGMSDHGPYPLSFSNIFDEKSLSKNEGYPAGAMNLNQMLHEYKEKIEEAKKAFPDMTVLASVEIEYFRGHDDYYHMLHDNLDYLLLGQHGFLDPIDNKRKSAYSEMNYENVIRYANVVSDALDTGLFKIMAHPDLFMFKYISENALMREFDNNARIASRIIIEACVRNNVLIEFNAGGVSRGKVKNIDGSIDYYYPRKEFFNIVKEYNNAKVIIGCDAHNPFGLHAPYLREAIEACMDMGFMPVNVRKK